VPTILGGLLAAYLVVPVLAVVTRLGPGYWAGAGRSSVWSALATSVLASTIATGVTAVTGIPLAWLLARSRPAGWRRRAANVVGAAVQIPLALPPLVSGLLLIRIVGPYTVLGRLTGGRLTESLWGIVLAQTFVAGPFLVVAARSGFASVDPALDRVAATLGHRAWSRFWLVDLGEAFPAVKAGMVLTWLRAFGEFGATVLLAYHPYSLPVFTYVQFDSSGLSATQVPVDLAIAAAVVVVAIGQLRPRRRRRPPPLPAPAAPAHHSSPSLDFSVSTRLGGPGAFSLAVAHRSPSPRVALLGPSGAGKSLTLQLLAGVRRPTGGWVRVGGREIGALPAEHREVGYVPQGGALLPRLDVWRQVTFGAAARPGQAVWWLERLGLSGLEGRRPAELSGGQAQRVALARALAGPARLLLLDEPLGALDTPQRRLLRSELRQLQRTTGLATVVVTHDPEEAAVLADEIVVLAGGAVLQAGHRSEVFGRPASVEVARLLGVDNVCVGAWAAPGFIDAGGGLQLPAAGAPPSPLPAAAGAGGESGPGAGSRAGVLWSVDPDAVQPAPGGRWPAAVVDVVDLGRRVEAHLELAPGVTLVSRHPGAEKLEIGMKVAVDMPPVDAWTPAPGDGGPQGLVNTMSTEQGSTRHSADAFCKTR
jgi:ABC-type Fe3+/spermidine/putrescine transport system ATPase subunit/ABC-type sulfate transport system permease component